MNHPHYKSSEQSTINILLAGVGGQGVLLASDILIEVALQADLDTKKSEIHGMAQRGGSVVSQVRYGRKIYSPLIPEGETDILLTFEKLEALRYLDALRPNGVVIFNTEQITPLTVFSTNVAYPQDIEGLCRRKTDYVFPVDGTVQAESLGNLKVVNSIMLGVLSQFIEFDSDVWKRIIATRVPQKTVALNSQAFDIGRKLIAAESKAHSENYSE
ncbi:indolepyruvate oxidoreductase subunit beta [candidate division KSB1 bacterium]|nr:indolepyruvate oxidoreductase subunit beta [candidate division KSB1 bacterium]